MKKIFTLLFVSILSFYAQAQYSTPGTGVNWNLNDLVQNSAGAVIWNGDEYEITTTIIIAPADAINILSDVTILFHDLAGIESSGTLNINSPLQSVFTAIDSTSANKWRGLKLVTDHVTQIRNVTFAFGGGVRVQTGTFSIHGSTFYKNYYKAGSSDGSYASSAALDLSGNTDVTNCTFLFNQRGAIASGSNIPCRANIRNNYIFGNTVENSNRPQINMGPSGASDTTFIVGNTVIGNGSTQAGGIAYSSLVGVAGNVVIDSNFIDQNRYGITLTGSPINGAIRYNTITDNNIQNEPNLGGSGINFTASSASSIQNAVVTGNVISGNLWGITIIGYPNVNMGDASAFNFNPGGNQFYNNGNGGILYDLYNNGPVTQQAMYNCWGVPAQDSASIETVVFHVVDNPALGRVNFMPSCAYQTFFAVQDASGNPLAGVEINIAGFDNTLYTNANGSVWEMIPPGNYTFTASLAGYDIYNGSFTVEPGTNLVNVTLSSGNYELTFYVHDENMIPLESAEISVDSQLLYTGANGTASIMLGNGTYSYLVSKEGYESVEGNAVIDGANTSVDVQLNSIITLYTVTFIVNSDIGFLEGVEILINGELLYTNQEGTAVIQLENGSYPYTATIAVLGIALDGTVVVDGADVQEVIFLDTEIEKLPDSGIALYPNPVANLLYFKGNRINSAEIYSLSGNLVHRYVTPGNSIDVSRLEPGTYLIHLYSGGKKVVKLVVKK
ncbi:MAG: carboxypeptidase regulatory-like domain-containing protein [Lentimicrobium sp.]|nr:carboxypeptidase regulatory-like domain-containing protein [Lentimicrobium sp.]